MRRTRSPPQRPPPMSRGSPPLSRMLRVWSRPQTASLSPALPPTALLALSQSSMAPPTLVPPSTLSMTAGCRCATRGGYGLSVSTGPRRDDASACTLRRTARPRVPSAWGAPQHARSISTISRSPASTRCCGGTRRAARCSSRTVQDHSTALSFGWPPKENHRLRTRSRSETHSWSVIMRSSSLRGRQRAPMPQTPPRTARRSLRIVRFRAPYAPHRWGSKRRRAAA